MEDKDLEEVELLKGEIADLKQDIEQKDLFIEELKQEVTDLDKYKERAEALDNLFDSIAYDYRKIK